MAPAILGRKIGMTQVFEESGKCIPVTIIEAGPCTVLQTKSTEQKDGYNAIQLGFDDVKPHRSTLPEIGHARNAKTAPKRFIREVRLPEASDQQIGDLVTVELFAENEVKWVDVVGTSKGKGYQGVMTRWNFGGQQASHGVERKHRSAGSISSHSANAGKSGRIKKGKKMSGRLGGERITVRSQKLVHVDPENNLLLVEGGVPGPKGGYVIVRKAKTRG